VSIDQAGDSDLMFVHDSCFFWQFLRLEQRLAFPYSDDFRVDNMQRVIEDNVPVRNNCDNRAMDV
jgi:hypothetical protein